MCVCVCQLSPGMLLDRRSVLRVAVGVGWGGHCHLMGCLLPAIEGRGNRILLCERGMGSAMPFLSSLYAARV